MDNKFYFKNFFLTINFLNANKVMKQKKINKIYKDYLRKYLEITIYTFYIFFYKLNILK